VRGAALVVLPRGIRWPPKSTSVVVMRRVIRTLAGSLRELVHRHPHAAPLLISRRALPEHALRVCAAYLRVLREDGVPEQCAVALVRSIITHGIGYALAELSCCDAQIIDATDDVVRTALLVCGDCDMTSQFEIGIDLMIHAAWRPTCKAATSTAQRRPRGRGRTDTAASLGARAPGSRLRIVAPRAGVGPGLAGQRGFQRTAVVVAARL
jgi:hypothetical protein